MFGPRTNQEMPPVLTPAERRVLGLIGQGLTTKEIASHLNVSVWTVGNQRRSICRKLEKHSTAELAAYGARLGAAP
jgi:DNA-binding CsgD family transcriptional regulator